MYEFGLQNCKSSKYPIDPGYHKYSDHNIEDYEDNGKYRSLIGSLLYLANNTRPDVAAAVGILAQRVSCPRRKDWIEAQRVLRYINGTKHIQLRLGKQHTDQLKTIIIHADADWAKTERIENLYRVLLYNGKVIYYAGLLKNSLLWLSRQRKQS